MRLYSSQPRFVYDILLSKGSFRPRPHEAGKNWIFEDAPLARFAYDWLCHQMVRRGLSRPHPNAYPVWAWHHYEGPNKPKPDLRDAAMKAGGSTERQVMFTLDVPDDRVLLHDYTAWHHPLNHIYLGTSKASDQFERQCKAAGVDLYGDRPLPEPRLLAQLEQSWETIFDLAAIRKKMRIRLDEQSVQATFWELRAEYVVDAVEFGMNRPKQKLVAPTNL